MMKKYKCTNTECHYSCELRSDLFPHKCVCWDYIPKWVEMDGTEPVTEINQLPKLTAEVFDREDCPADAKIAVVNNDGSASWGTFETATTSSYGGWMSDCLGEWYDIPGKWDASDWQNSLIERPAKLPEWVEIGGYVYDDRNGYGKIVSGSVKSCYIEFDGGAGDFVPEAFAELKQARLRPYNAEEMKALVGKVIEEKKTGDISFVTGYCNVTEKIYAGQNNFVAELLLSNYTIDGQPCGVLEHYENGEWVE